MKKISFSLSALFLVLPFSVLMAQSNRLIPVEVKKAYLAGTRSKDGAPGTNYWENHAHYQINAQCCLFC